MNPLKLLWSFYGRIGRGTFAGGNLRRPSSRGLWSTPCRKGPSICQGHFPICWWPSHLYLPYASGGRSFCSWSGRSSRWQQSAFTMLGRQVGPAFCFLSPS